ncbi:division protein [Anaeramoeba ignava]|uniref:Division protein n=1 Tax=Anaeramoeba ignava TaxID=1746090 RepID=A0A9Q0LLG4_ANAIG|nr:division protein [Anaeramoeba ignava]
MKLKLLKMIMIILFQMKMMNKIINLNLLKMILFFNLLGIMVVFYSVYCLSYCSTKNILASGGGDETCMIWKNPELSTITNKKVLPDQEYRDFQETVSCLDFSANGEFLAMGCMDGTVKITKLSTGKQVTAEGPTESIEWVKWHPIGLVFLVGCADGTCWMFNAKGNFLNMFAGHKGSITCGGFSPNGKRVVTGSEDGTARIWDPKLATTTQEFSGLRFHKAGLTSLEIDSNNSLLLSGSKDGTAILCHIERLKVLGTFDGGQAKSNFIPKKLQKLEKNDEDEDEDEDENDENDENDEKPQKFLGSVESVGFSPTMPLFATGSLTGDVRIWDLGTLRLRNKMVHDEGVTKILWHPTDPLIISGSIDQTVRVWDTRNAENVRTFYGHHSMILDLAFNAKDNQIFSCSDDHEILSFKI